uniref:G_PROTEIN_RECEP_F1_2 domain-containing protein n=1 Tax=Globodera pallida TaxID=36090 RepID=A0A183BIK2_GLOPA
MNDNLSSSIPQNSSSDSDCVEAQLYGTNSGYVFVRWAHMITGLAILLLLANIFAFIVKKRCLPLHGNLKLMLLNLISVTCTDPCQYLTPVWLAYLLRMPAYIYLIASPLFHFAIMIERVRATIFVRKYEREGLKCGIGGIIFLWLITALFSVYIVYTSLQDTVTFSKPLIYISMTTKYNAQVFINIHYFFLFLVTCVSLADYVLIRLNKLVVQRAKARMEYNLSRSYQSNENIVTIRLLFPLDFSYSLFFTIFIVLSAYVRMDKDAMGLLVYNRAYEGIQLILSLHAVITLATYLYFLKQNRRLQNTNLTVAEQARQHFRLLQAQTLTSLDVITFHQRQFCNSSDDKRLLFPSTSIARQTSHPHMENEGNELLQIEKRDELIKKLKAEGILYISLAEQRLGDVLNTPTAGTLHNILLFYEQASTTNDRFLFRLSQLFKMAVGRDNCIFVDLELLLRYPELGARLITMRGGQLLTLDCVTAEIRKSWRSALLGLNMRRRLKLVQCPQRISSCCRAFCRVRSARLWAANVGTTTLCGAATTAGRQYLLRSKKNDKRLLFPSTSIARQTSHPHMENEGNELLQIEKRDELIKKLKAEGILYISLAEQRLGDVLNTPTAGTLHNILLFYEQASTTNDRFLFRLSQLFKMAVGRDNCIFVDLELLLRDPAAEIPDAIRSLEGYPELGARLITMRGGQLLTLDCVTAEIEKLAICTARIEHAQKIEVGAVPSADQQLLPCVLPCPLSKALGGKCRDDDFVWGCDDCGQTISFVKQEKAPITHLFCDCGRTPVDEFKFRVVGQTVGDAQQCAKGSEKRHAEQKRKRAQQKECFYYTMMTDEEFVRWFDDLHKAPEENE